MIGELISAGASIIGGLMGNRQKKKEYEHQKEFAQNSIQWKTKDALKAGVHPLFAMGAPTVSYQASAGGYDLSSGLADAGQSIGRAVAAGASPEAKTNATLTALSVERAGLENDLLRSQIRAINAPGTPPGVPVVGDNADPLVIAGKEITRSPLFSDVQDFQNRYGEPAEWFLAAPIAAADSAATFIGTPASRAAKSEAPTGNSWSDWFYGRR